jgi:glyoxylase-like metal-dependent hydrolase (beta-lactamase superfamily II)
MATRRLGEILIDRVIESEEPFLPPHEMFAEATPEALAPHRPWLEPRALCPESGKLILPVQSYLLRTRHHTILIDSCVGNDKSFSWHEPWHRRRDPTWLANLAAAGVRPERIDFVLCTHLHVDHCGWNTRLVEGRWVPTFPNARYVFSRQEFAHRESLDDTTFRENVLPVMEAGQGVLVEMDHALSGGEEAVMTGDLIHSPLQCAHPDWNFLYDDDPEQARRTRRAFLEAQCETGRLVLTAHFPSPSVGHVLAKGDAFAFRYA